MRRIVSTYWVDQKELEAEVAEGVVREVFDGNVLVEDDLLEFDSENPRRFKFRQYVPVCEVRALVFIDGPGVRSSKTS